jgi:hypothetical protein
VTGFECSGSHAPPSPGGRPAFPAYFPVDVLAPPAPARPTPKQPWRRLDRALWPEIAARAEHESLRELAAVYGVSHETIRAVVLRVAKTEHRATAD